jgi:hypothetical protein
MSASKFYSMRSCNDDYVPEFRVTRSTCEPNELEKKKIENDNKNSTDISLYSDANIQFRESKYVFPWLQTDADFEPDARLEALDAKLEAICAEFEKKLNGSEDDIVRPDFEDDDDIERIKYREDRDYKRYCQTNSFHEEEEFLIYDDSGEMTPRGRVLKLDKPMDVDFDYDDDHYEEFSRSDRFDNDHELCSECQLITKIIAYGWRHPDDNLCMNCVNLPGMDDYEC